MMNSRSLICGTPKSAAFRTALNKAYPVFFNKTSGAQGTRTYCIVNSVSNATKYTANATQIVYPTEMTPDTPVVVSGGGSGGNGGGTTV